ncbi:MAG: enoyl-CoA hydratase-related protein [Chloroflexi bacterium]|nr:enoyl-CoA hydratase-related protein [Chloroflexota bacterium]MDA1220147.1 enoyl-CoA hydratase-related protein [Chloroflexota bacterium]
MSSSINMETSAIYQPAGVKFNFSLTTPKEGGQAQLDITVDDLATGKRLPFSHQACPAVHDFTRGFARWLGTKGFPATLNVDEIVATPRAELTQTQLIQGFRDALDMVEQKFSNYLGPIIGSNSYSDVVYRKDDGVAWLLLNRPETFNAKRGITMDEMANCLLDAAGDSSIRVVVISGAGPNGFCTGNDQSYDPELETSDYRGEAEIRYGQVIQQMAQPVIAAVDGYAIGSGNILAYTCDFTVATTRSRFGQTGPRVGSPANGHNVAMLAARVGQKRAREIWMLCRQYTAQQAYDMGLVNAVVEPNQLWAEVDRWIADIKNVSPVILQMQKMSFNRHDHFQEPETTPIQEYMPDYFASEECRERRLAFIERRKIDPSKNVPIVKIPIR